MRSDKILFFIFTSLILVPDFALFNSGAMGRVTMFWITGIFCQQLAGDVGALAAVEKAFVLAAGGYRAFPMEGMAIGLNTASTVAGFFVLTSSAVQSTS